MSLCTLASCHLFICVGAVKTSSQDFVDTARILAEPIKSLSTYLHNHCHLLNMEVTESVTAPLTATLQAAAR